jgi:hypothetical protein
MNNNSKIISYHKRLNEHIDKYLSVVLAAPEVRLNEFKQLVQFSQLDNPALVLELPAEIGMLEQVFSGTKIERADWLKINLKDYGNQIVNTDFSFTGISADYYDAVLAIVPFHHGNIEEKSEYVAGAMRALRQGGTLAFGEVEHGSREHYFLDEFIHQHTPTGHQGMYVTSEFKGVLVDQGFQNVACELISCPWVFDSVNTMLSFIYDLFNLKEISEKDLLRGLENYLGIKEHENKFYLNWQLYYFKGIKPTTESL